MDSNFPIIIMVYFILLIVISITGSAIPTVINLMTMYC